MASTAFSPILHRQPRQRTVFFVAFASCSCALFLGALPAAATVGFAAPPAAVFEKLLSSYFTGLFAPGTCAEWVSLFAKNGSMYHPKVPAGAHGWDELAQFCETTRSGTPDSVYTPTGAPPSDPVDTSGGRARFAVPYVWAANQLKSPIVNWGVVTFAISLPEGAGQPLIETADETWTPKTRPWNRQTQAQLV
jgi:hypothetical protein